MKRYISIFLTLALLLLTACGTAEQAPASEPESGPSSASEPSSVQPEPESSSVPEESSQPEPVPDPDPDGWEPNPDTVDMEIPYDRMNDLRYHVQEAFLAELPASSYNHFDLYYEGTEIVLEIAVTDEAAVDAYLAGWTGEKWDRLIKTPARLSRAKLTEFVTKAEKLDFGPEVEVNDISAMPALNESEAGVAVWIVMSDPYASLEEVERWKELPRQLKDLAKETGIPEDMIVYRAPYYHEPGVNYDT